MRKWIIFLFVFLGFFCASETNAQSEYTITNFRSEITVEQDTTLLVTETITVNFPFAKHGIYRNIPYVYTANGKSIRVDLDVENVTDENGVSYIYEVSRSNGNVQVKIGDPDKTITGYHVYSIHYSINDVIQRYEDHDELYWNVTGHDWDTEISSVETTVSTSYADITRVTCFTGYQGSTDEECTKSITRERTTLTSQNPVEEGDDFTIVIGFSKNNEFIFPTPTENAVNNLFDNWGYLVSVLPILVFGYLWWKKGRDLKYAGENVYYKPENAEVVTKPLFIREHLPTVYSPIQGFSPSELGTILDGNVDIHDIVSEITELARLGYLKIVKLEKDRLIGKSEEYLFVKLKDDAIKLPEYQEYLFGKIFESEFTDKANDVVSEWAKKDSKATEYVKLAMDNKVTALSSLSKHFYKYLDPFKEKLYKELAKKEIFDGSPDKVRQKWILLLTLIEVAVFVSLFVFADSTNNYYPMYILVFLTFPAIVFAYQMPRRKPWGYSLYRQIQGLSFYLEKGKWREEVAEKQLFFAEMLPIAISLGVVNELAKDMQGLGIEPPKYVYGMHASSLATDFRSFETKAASSFISTPSGKAGGSWSGGSGFSGGSSGGGFGGGGGGSW